MSADGEQVKTYRWVDAQSTLPKDVLGSQRPEVRGEGGWLVLAGQLPTMQAIGGQRPGHHLSLPGFTVGQPCWLTCGVSSRV